MVRDRMQTRIDRLQQTGLASRFVRRRLDPDSPTGLVLTVGVLMAIVALFGFVVIAGDVLWADQVHGVDRAINEAMAQLRTPGLTRAFVVLTHSGDTASMFVLVALAAMLGVVLGRKPAAVYIAVTVAGGSIIANVLKAIFGRGRPPLDLAALTPPASASFPSGHTMASFLFAATLIVGLVPAIERRWMRGVVTALLALWALSVAFSRVYLGVHWMSDVFASWFLGAAWFSITTAVYLGAMERRAN